MLKHLGSALHKSRHLRLLSPFPGSLIAFAPRPTALAGFGARTLQQWGPVAGLGLVVYSLFWFDESTPIPSVYALAPVGGTALIIATATPGHPVSRLLTARPLVAIGLISYSAYLWHQPLFALRWGAISCQDLQHRGGNRLETGM